MAQRLLAYQVMERWLTGDATTFEQRIMDVAAGVGYCEDNGQSSGCFATGQALSYASSTVIEIAYGMIGLRAGSIKEDGASGPTTPSAGDWPAL